MRKHKSIFDMQFITAGISTTMVLFLLGLVVFFVLTANNLSVYIRENIAFSAILDDGIKETSIIKLQESLNKKDYVKQTVYISKDQALKEQIEAMGTDPSEFLGHNPFNASIEIRLNAGYTHPDSIKWIEKELMTNKSILEVSYPQNLLESVNRNLQKISVFLLGLAVLLSLISFSLINNTIRLTIYSKRDLWKVRDRNIAEIFVPSRQNIRIQCVAKMCLCESKGAFYVLSEESLPRGQIYQDAVLHCEN